MARDTAKKKQTDQQATEVVTSYKAFDGDRS